MKTKTPSMDANLSAESSPLNLAGVDPYARARDKVAIVGMASTTAGSTPFLEPDWEIWGLNNNAHVYLGLGVEQWSERYFRADRWFELHPREIADDERCVTELRTACVYVVDASEWPEGGAPGTHVATFPRKRAVAAGRYRTFASTFSWQVALAIAMGYREIGLFGVELTCGREGLFEKASLAYWLGVAEGKGITVTVPPNSTTLWHPALYGLEYWKEIEYVGHIGRLLQPTFRKTTNRPPTPRPPESYEYEREARMAWPEESDAPRLDDEGEPLP